ncbi:DegT/DnrJ/EryC1/StrS family aminotransferase [Flagellimonas halotolerans]|uniref:Aminotransferase class I/II-fold pyridoxal phosphate-dependent enzyme n=1 Tax=Flagellimonas halotolerans TaxID=3112164 RepID=A0ABU6ISD6_9FLAO|nr:MULTISPECIES: aminotransferase class I/II-fold pyridoxal phosphate-dependent enzyme [unclassified Allomuricauda]MEC3966168.1 aminotransferase class I/II-fold pyridoxal phosphate-dependent enzyme [Muricauda sp. SYSU M86414]MEC4266033.1 aminotransferase class I/II-fold pyridoxal phosphate-dependent enzyme [Muricauda sp. SYSU M84420]
MQTIVLKKIWLSSPHMGHNEENYIKEAFETNWIAPLGPNVQLFEKSISEYIGNDVNTACLSSGTAAIHLALELLGIGYGDEVLCQSFTFSASANPITYLGATPIFVDSEEDTWNISPELLEVAILDRIKLGKTPKAIVAVHLYGMPYKVQEIQDISKKYNIPVVEDSAEALGSIYKGIKCGSFGDFGILSFNGNKIITTSGGGALLSKDKEAKEKAIFLATQARDNAPHYQHSTVGYNYRMSNVLAGIGRGQMEVLEARVLARRKNFEYYKNHLSDVSGIQFLDEPKGCLSNRWLTCILTQSFEDRERIRLALLEENIESRPLWKPMHLQPVFQENPSYVNGVSEHLFDKGLCLPSGSNLDVDDLERICEIIKGLLQ